MFREVHEVHRKVQDLQGQIRSAILADTTPDMTRFGGSAQALVDEVLLRLRRTQSEGAAAEQDVPKEERVERRFVDAAANSLNLAWSSAESVGLGTNVSEMRARLLDLKTHADFAEAYLHAALGTEME